MVGFRDLVGVGTAPVSKKTAVKCVATLITLREIIYISYKIGDQGPRIGIPCCIVLHFLCRNVSKLVVIGYSGEGTKILYLSII